MRAEVDLNFRKYADLHVSDLSYGSVLNPFQVLLQTLRSFKHACSHAHRFLALWRIYGAQPFVSGSIIAWHCCSALNNLHQGLVLAGLTRVPELTSRLKRKTVSLLHRFHKFQPTLSNWSVMKHQALIDAWALDVTLKMLALISTYIPSLSHGFPRDGCTGVMHPICKYGDAHNARRYWGITTFPVLSEVVSLTLLGNSLK